MTIINPNSISGISSITALNSTAAINLFKADGTAANIIAGVTTGTNFKTGSSNLHNVGIEIAGINVLGADTPIGAGATIYNSGAAVFTGIVTANNLNVTNDIDVTDDLTIGGEFNMIGSSDSAKYFDARTGASNQLHFRSSLGGASNLVTILSIGRNGSSFVGNLTLGDSSDTSSAAGPEFMLNRNSASPANADYLGQIKFAGRSSTGVQRNYAKITGKILDVTNGAEDGILEFAHIKNGSQVITGRWRSDSLQLLNSTNFSVAGTSDFTGTATFSGVSNFNSNVSVSGNLNVAQNIVHTGDTDTKLSFYNDVITLDTAGIERFRIYNDGVVAIGQSSKSSTVGAGNLDIQGNATSCIIEMGNPFPGFSGGVVPEFRITATNSGHTVDFESVWGGDNLLHKHLAFSGGSTIFYKGTNNDEIARFNSNKFGVGTASPGQLIHTHSGSSSGGLQIQSNGSTNYVAAIQTANNFANGSTAGGLVIRSGNGIELSGNDGSTVQMRLASSGDLSITDGNLVVASGHGIDFSALGQASGMTSELFDVYEEGTWTPYIYPLSSNIPVTYSHQSGRYTQIGNVVYWHFKLQVSNITGNRNQAFGINGFPHNNTNSQEQVSGNFYGENWDGEMPTTIKYIGNTNRGQLYYYTDAMTYSSSSMLDINVSSSKLWGSGFYYTS